MQGNKKELMDRLKRVEGQIRGIQKMIEEDRYCIDVLYQVSASRAALKKLGMQMVRNHTRACVANAIRQEHGDEAIDELMQFLDKFVD
ncbi:MAG: metal-sensitive transcriptional regulator [Firmicutes bacterium]|nr:metal-sensitive transcriptional regulator [Bacillota bacterium]